MDKVRLCRECEEPIPAKRLKALPNTTLCVECAQDLEKKKASYLERNPSALGQEWLEGTVEALEEQID